MEDRALLELAAKAAGYKFDSTNPFEIAQEHKGGTNWIEWNPLTDDGDALRLAVQLYMEVSITPHGVYVTAAHGPCSAVYGSGDKGEAVRRTIVRAAAEDGRLDE